MIEHSESIGKITAAILNVQRAVDHVAKGASNPHYGNTYADLNTFLHALRGPLAEHGVTMVQGPGMDGSHVTVDTLLVHSSGEWIRNRAAAPMQKNDPQGAGSAITYLRRYSLAALFAVPQEDDDGNAASDPKPRQERKAAPNGPTCPKCGGGVWDNRTGKKNPRSPDWACKDKDGCGFALWLDSARQKIREDAEALVQRGAIKPESVEHVMQGLKDGDLDALRLAQDWIAEKGQAAA